MLGMTSSHTFLSLLAYVSGQPRVLSELVMRQLERGSIMDDLHFTSWKCHLSDLQSNFSGSE